MAVTGMAEYIERESAYEDFEKCNSENPKWTPSRVKTLITRQKAVDAVEVVRCRKCKHWKPSGSKAGNSFSDMEYIGGCEFTNYYRTESDFCSYGERKEGAD